MKKLLFLFAIAAILQPMGSKGETILIWQMIDASSGIELTQICEEPAIGDGYITADNAYYEIIQVNGNTAAAALKGKIEMPALDWMDVDAAYPVTAVSKRIALYCTHSDESFEPSDGYYSTTGTGTIYQVAHTLADRLSAKGIDATISDTLHHPHDAGAYRRSRQTAVQLLKEAMPDCLIDIHRDGIPDPASYAEINKEFALLIKAVADRVYPGLIKDIYMGKGTFNQDLLPRSILFECGTYTLEKDRVFASMPMMADVLNRALYGGVIGSTGHVLSDSSQNPIGEEGIVQGMPDADHTGDQGIGSGAIFLGAILIVGIAGYAFLSAGSLKRGASKTARNLSEMTGGLIGKKPRTTENHEHS